MSSSHMSIKARRTIGRIVLHCFILLGAVIVSLPFLWMLSSSLKSTSEVLNMDKSFWARWIPESFLWSNYAKAFTYNNYQLIKGLMNTLTIAIPSLVVGLTAVVISAYGFSKMKFPGRDKIFFALICTMMIPGVVTLVPSYILFSKLNWKDTFLPLIVPGMFGSVMGVFFVRQFFMALPDELIESARIDGCGELRILFNIVAPVSVAAIATQAVMGFMGIYNDYTGPLLYLDSPEKFTLQLALSNMQGYYSTNWPLIMAGAMLALVPSAVLFFVAQNYFIEGIVSTGLKA